MNLNIKNINVLRNEIEIDLEGTKTDSEGFNESFDFCLHIHREDFRELNRQLQIKGWITFTD